MLTRPRIQEGALHRKRWQDRPHFFDREPRCPNVNHAMANRAQESELGHFDRLLRLRLRDWSWWAAGRQELVSTAASLRNQSRVRCRPTIYSTALLASNPENVGAALLTAFDMQIHEG